MYPFGKSKWFAGGLLASSLLLLGCAHSRGAAPASPPRVAEHMIKPAVIPPEVVSLLPPPAERDAEESVVTSSVDVELRDATDPVP